MTYSSIPEISVTELAQLMADQETPRQFIDVREPGEVAIASIPEFQVLPLSQFAEWGGAISTRFDLETETIVLCHYGMRSAQMCQWLISQGFSNVKNVSGGINSYSVMIDPNVPKY
ncbi:Rhodanese-related sulfurtransferase [Xenococcus sp. PCC 7305]|uniref:rhodanese-like domain-containing protein n=1 Tax=Xenococcus sp. PCC 7305 TaxID=102125 RepID=UPI0002ACCA5C|nr:rhodanese-like domain-containing protein [Xenococcus sp. PCC 7305]ELS04209.1 Rhodanese-related sulfurtransferase [Xenococcus sp. PCC 7305]